MDLSIDGKLLIKNGGKAFTLKTPVAHIPFGVEDYYNSKLVKLSLPTDNQFSTLIISIEDKFKELLGIDEISSQLLPAKNKNYGDLLITKIVSYKNNYNIKVDKSDGTIGTTADITKGSKGIATLLFDRIWKKEDKYYYKIKLKELALL
jgi:hypothetical protein